MMTAAEHLAAAEKALEVAQSTNTYYYGEQLTDAARDRWAQMARTHVDIAVALMRTTAAPGDGGTVVGTWSG